MGQKASIVGSSRQRSYKKLDQKRKEEQEKAPNDSNLNKEQEQEPKQNQLINQLQEQAKQTSSLLNGLRSDLEDARQKTCLFENRYGEIESQLLEEQKDSWEIKKRVEELEAEIRSVRKQMETEIDVQRARKELEDEKATREEAEAKIVALEQEMSVATEELHQEKRRLKVATHKITLVDTYLGDFESTAQEMKGLFEKQRNELNQMQTSLMEVEQGIRHQEDYRNGGDMSFTTLQELETASSAQRLQAE